MRISIYPNDVAIIENKEIIAINKKDDTYKIDGVSDLIVQETFRLQFEDRSVGRVLEYEVIPGKTDEESGKTSPTSIRFRLISNKMGTYPCSFSYQTSGLSWSSFYDVVILDGEKINLSIFASLSNRCSVLFPKSKIVLVSPFGLGEQIKIHLEEETELPSQTTKHVEMINLVDMGMKKKFVAHYNSPAILKVLSLFNSQEEGLGFDLPPGDVRISGISEDSPVLINSFRIKGFYNNSSMEIMMDLSPLTFIGGWDAGICSIEISNPTEDEVEVFVEEMCQEDYLIMASTHRFFRKDQDIIFFVVPVPPKSSSLLSYQVDPSLMDSGLSEEPFDQDIID